MYSAFIEKAKEYAKQNNTEKLMELENYVCNQTDANLAYYYAMYVEGANKERLANVVLEHGTAKDCLLFARYIKNVDNDDFVNKIISSKNMILIGEYANLKDSNIKLIEDYVISSNSVPMVLSFAKQNIKGVNYKALQDIVYSSNMHEYIISFAKSVKEADVNLARDIILETEDLNLILKFAKSVILDTKDCKILENYVLENGMPHHLVDYADSVYNANVTAVRTKLNELGESSKAYMVGRIKKVDKYPVKDPTEARERVSITAIINSANDIQRKMRFYNNPNLVKQFRHLEEVAIWKGFITLNGEGFAERVKGANIKKIENFIVKTNDPLAIYLFAKNVKGANIKRLYDAIKMTGDEEQIFAFESFILKNQPITPCECFALALDDNFGIDMNNV